MSYYNTGLSPTSARGLVNSDTNVIGAPVGVASSTSESTPQAQANNQGTGGIAASNAALQNITNFSGSKGTLMGNYNYDRGLQNYNQYNQSAGLGGIGGQTTPWGLRSKQEGGYGGDTNSYDYFVNPNTSGLAYGQDYSLNGGMLGSRDIMRNAYTGGVQGYGENQYQRQENPLGYDFWAGQTAGIRNTGTMDYAALTKQINDLASQYAGKMQTMYGGGNNQFQAPDIQKLAQQLVMQGNPGMRDSNGPLNAWYMYANNQGLAQNPYEYYADLARQTQGTAMRSFR